MKRILSAFLLSIPLAAGAGEADPAERIAELEAKRERLVEERDAARMRANVYVLPQDKLEAAQKQEEIDAVDDELRSLRKDGPKQE